MKNVRHEKIELASGVSNSSEICLNHHEAALLQVSDPAAIFGTASVTVTLYGAYNSGVAGVPLKRYDASALTVQAANFVVNTAAIYELPPHGECPNLKLVFSTVATAGGTIYIVYPSNAQ